QQLILDSLDFKLERIDLSHEESKEKRDNKAREICQQEAARPFDLARGPLLRGQVIQLGEQEHILLLNMHHIISDGWSLGVLIRELGLIREALQQGRRPELPPLPVQYADYSVWQRRWLEEGGVLKRQLGYWQEKLAGVPESLDLATDYARPGEQSFAGARHEFGVDAELTGQLKKLGEQQGGTLFMVLLAAWKVLLYRYTGQEDICVGSPIANRQYVLEQVKATCLEAYEHQDAPFEKVVEAVRPQRNMAISPLFQVMLIVQNADGGRLAEHIRPYRLESGISKFDLSVDFTETGEGLAGSIEYSTALYKPQTMARLAGHFTALCKAITATPAVKIGDLDYLSDAEKHQLLTGFNATQADYPKDKCIHELFAERVGINPGKTAVVCGEQELSYQELYERSSDLALYLQSMGVKPDCLVGLCVDRSPDMIVGLLGILMAGGAYVPLDPDYPEERLAYMLEDSQAAIVLTQEKLQDKLSALVPATTQLIALDQQQPGMHDCVVALKAKNIQLQHQVKPHHLAYVIYTSGSTGQPKGVMVEHANVVRLFSATDGWFQFNENDVWTMFHSYAFDFSVWEIWGALLYGGHLIVVPKNIARSPQEFYKLMCLGKVTVLNQTPSAFRQLITAQAESKESHQLRYVIFGGEALDVVALKPWYELNRHQHTRLINMYGITETTVHVTYRPLEPADVERHGASPIGCRIPDLRTYILDSQRQPVPIGVAGELYVGGAGVARGYLNRTELTAERFVRDPFATDPSARMYKTGDLGRWLVDGTIEFLGRNDDQVKIRGFRIELGEIEARLAECAGIQQAVVVAREEGGGEKRLVAYYTSSERSDAGKESVGPEQLRAQLAPQLPEYMVPAAYVRMEKMPLTTNGKLDRKALPEPEGDAYAKREYEAPQGEIETALGEIWAEVLKVERVGRQDNFFELGGHSLSAVQLMAKINRRFNQLLPLSVMFTAPNIVVLAKLISNREATSTDILVPIQTNGSAPPVFGIPGAGGNVLSLQPLSKALGSNQPFYGLQAVGLDGKTLPLNSVEQTAKANIAALKTVQPHGPYILLGHSYGGVVAYEMARMLLEQAEQISSLILLDSLAPSVMQKRTDGDETTSLFDACAEVANLHGATLVIDLERLRQSSREENVQYIVNLLNDCGVEINNEQFAAFYSVYQTNLLCYRTYQPLPLPREIDVSLYRATQGHEDGQMTPHDCGWNQLLPGPVRVHDIEANHFSMLEEPHIQKIAGAFSLPTALAASY
ncbi:MAG: amino acid adenylation domain-containing protein, partial [Acidobacteriia bacterium]|nr:amino acid adenylation domain-containing protein [Terriglobia bacterium]